ncbi:PepSY domain-containing protein [Flavisolibacter tropicus]|uniref:PepSY domain-containing protein n=1 Tax=Flavisolibacter tropicus TaxID=1492898 RepID=UPI001D0418BF|nr:PepSY-associated TM helix domain-containing protein [Flavisolibacter tropicus]
MKELSAQSYYGRYKDAVVADKPIRMNYDLHTGAIRGIAGKILVFCASLIAASLPVTRFYIWWGRRNKKKVAKPVAVNANLAGSI